MKKIILASLVLASTTAFADITDPMFLPKAGRVVSETGYDYMQVDDADVAITDITEKISVGLSDRFALSLASGLQDTDVVGDDWRVTDLTLGARYRAYSGNMSVDILADVAKDIGADASDDMEFDLGVIAGKDMGNMTSAGVINLNYYMYDAAGMDDEMALTFESRNQYRFNNKWSMNGDLMLTLNNITEENMGDMETTWGVKVGFNYSFTDNAVFSVYGGYADLDTDTAMLAGAKFTAQF
jgi:hypothetical protein